MKRILVLFIVIFLTDLVFGQIPPFLEWQRNYGDDSNEILTGIMEIEAEGYIASGYVFNPAGSVSNFYLIRTDENGDTLWTRTFGDGTSIGNSLEMTADGGYAIAGEWNAGPNLTADACLIKLNAAGDTIWSKTYGGSQDEYFFRMRNTSDNGFILCGGTASFGWGDYDMYIVKTDSVGDTLWTRTFGGVEYDAAYSMWELSSGGYVVCGGIGYPTGESDMYVVKLNDEGNLCWLNFYDNDVFDLAIDIRETSDNGLIIAGITGTPEDNTWDYYFVRTDSVGNIIWQRVYGGPDFDAPLDVIETEDGGFVIGGSSITSAMSSMNLRLFRIDASGDSIWSLSTGSGGYDFCNSFIQCADGGYAAAGYSDSFTGTDYNGWLVKLTSEGTIVGGRERHFPVSLSIYSIYPNPFNQQTIITLQLRDSDFIRLKIYDIKGREVESLISGFRSSGDHEVLWEAEGFPSGVYFARLEGGRKVQTVKMVLVK